MKLLKLKKNSKKGFRVLESINRAIVPAHVSKIAESIQAFKECLRPVIVAVIDFLPSGRDLYIIDGQHLYQACLRLKMDTPYSILEQRIKSLPELIEKIALLNNSSKSWTLENYIDTWSYYKKEYQEFKLIFNRYNIERSILAELLHTGIVSPSRTGGAKHSVIKAIKTGKLRIVNRQLAYQVLDYVMDLRDITKDLGRVEQRLLISVMIEKIKADGATYNHKKYKLYLTKIKKKLLFASNDIDTLRVLLSN